MDVKLQRSCIISVPTANDMTHLHGINHTETRRAHSFKTSILPRIICLAKNEHTNMNSCVTQIAYLIIRCGLCVVYVVSPSFLEFIFRIIYKVLFLCLKSSEIHLYCANTKIYIIVEKPYLIHI